VRGTNRAGTHSRDGRWLLLAVVCFLSPLACLPARAQMPLHPPEIRTLFPIGGVQGSTVEVLIDGQNVSNPSAVAISGDGVRASIVSEESTTPTRIVGNATARIRLEIAPDAPLGIRELRLLTPAGLTNRALFEVSRGMTSLRESEPNNLLATAQNVPIPVTVEGRINPREDVDVYRFTVRSGDELLFRVTAQPLESSLDAYLTLRDAGGRELAANDDYATRDPVLAYRFEKAGEYAIEVRDDDYGGSLESSYRLTISREPYLRTVYPLGVRRGTVADLQLFGLDLAQLAGRGSDWYMPENEVPQARYEVAPDVPPGPREFRLTTPGGISNPVMVEVLDVPEVREVEPNDDAPRAQRLPVPGVAHGQIYGGKANPKGELDLWRFAAKKGQKLRLSIRARAAGSLLDALLTVRDSGGKKLAHADDSETSRDPSLEFDPPADGDYLAEVTDLNGEGGLGYVYMLRIEPVPAPHPDFSLAIYPANPSVPRGGSVPVEVRVTRAGGFTGPIRFELPPLPAGVTAFIPEYAATADRFYVALSATADAEVALGPFGVTGVAEIEGKSVSHTATGSERVWNLAPLHAVPTTLMNIGVCEPPDFKMRLDRYEVTLAPGESADVTAFVDKLPNYPRGIPIRAATVDYEGGALPAGLSIGRVTLPPEADQVSVRISASAKAKPGEYPVFVCGLSNPSTNDYILVGYLAPPLRVKVVEKVAATQP
jgi:Bacterial pre-peptidase C-terminal domain